MEIKEIRKNNLEILIAKAGSVAALAEMTESNSSHISQLRSGYRNVGHLTARRLEQAFDLPEGSMDMPWIQGEHITGSSYPDLANCIPLTVKEHAAAHSYSPSTIQNVEPGPRLHGAVPIISWVQAGDLCEAIDNLHPGDNDGTVYCPSAHSKSTYALRVCGLSMQPVFSPGEIVIIDPERAVIPGSYVIAKRQDSNEATLKQYLTEAGTPYLKAANPDWPEQIIKVDENWRTCGVVIASVKTF